MSTYDTPIAGKAVAISLGLFVAAGVGISAATVNSRDTETITVTSAERVRSGDSDRYLVFTEDDGTYEVTDSILAWRFDSSDVYGQIEEGATYEIEHQGWRVPIMSSYPNIIELTEVTE